MRVNKWEREGMSSPRYCRCCQRPLGAIRVGDWCEPCALNVLEDVGRLQNLRPGEIVSLSDMFTTVGALALARAMVAGLPFEDGR